MSATGPRIAVVDYGMGNRRSVEKALALVGARVRVTRDHAQIAAADGLVVPGVGAFPRAMGNLRELGLDRLVAGAARGGTPVLGICLGMQLLFERSSELGGAPGLGLLVGDVAPLAAGGRRLPHIGWNLVTWAGPSAITARLPRQGAFYHVHSFAPRPADPGDVLGTAEYGARFVTAVARPPLYGVQFHPEKSSALGLRLLANFAEACAQGRRGAVRAA
jgi:glutamine amidotransferase